MSTRDTEHQRRNAFLTWAIRRNYEAFCPVKKFGFYSDEPASQPPLFCNHLHCLWKLPHTKGEAETERFTVMSLSQGYCCNEGSWSMTSCKLWTVKILQTWTRTPEGHHENLVYQCCDYHKSPFPGREGGNHLSTKSNQFIPFSAGISKNSRPCNSIGSATVRNTVESILPHRASGSWLWTEPSASKVGALGISVT